MTVPPTQTPLTEDVIWNNGERQAGTTIETIRADHRGRYEFATRWLVEQGRTRIDILDAACGTGYGSRILANGVPGARVHGIDVSPDAIAWGKRHFAGRDWSVPVELVQGDCLQLPFDAESFHAVVSFETLEHLDAPTFLAEVHSVLKPGGIFFGSTPNQDVLPWSPDFLHHLRHYTPSELQDLIESAGLTILGRHSNADRWTTEIVPGWEGLFNIVIAKKA